MKIANSFVRWAFLVSVSFALILAGQADAAVAAASITADQTAATVSVQGGLCVQIGGDASFASELAKTGRFLVHVLQDEGKAIEAARHELQSQGLYGLASVDRFGPDGTLPYTEDLVNLVVVYDDAGTKIPTEEVKRVLCPKGVLLVVPGVFSAAQLEAEGFVDVRTMESGRPWLTGKKPWPSKMDEWSHPRHSAAGNPVSEDSLVGPPRRVRWVVGAQAEVRGLVSSGGRNFYAAALARDGFNGLRLWDRDLLNPTASGDHVMKNAPGNIPLPIAAGKYLFAVTGQKLVALNAATGETVREYPEAGRPQSVIHDEGILLVVSGDALRAVDVESGRLLWQHDAPQPRNVVAGDEYVGLAQGRAKRGEPCELVGLDKVTGKQLWNRKDFPWSAHVSRSVYYRNMLAYEVSTYNDTGPGNAIHIVSAKDGKALWSHEFLPGMNHARQARAMFVDDLLWILHGGKGADKKRLPIQCSALDLKDGKVQFTHYAGLAHCFPPVATSRYMLAGEMDFTDLKSGKVDAHQITKAACGRDHGWVPANGLTYVTPKHCVCWPMLRGYAALAPERPGNGVADMELKDITFVLEKAVEPPAKEKATDGTDDWPCYRHDAWRSGSTTAAGPSQLNTLWSVDLGDDLSEGPIVADWRENPFVKGPVTSPVIAGGLACVARPDAHEVVALDAATGQVRWRFTAGGRVDTPPTLYRGLCLFGAKNGWVYCLRADDGKVVWKRRCAPLDERIVAYGQVESPWPVPGSVLVVDDTAYFAAGRQSLADGGIFVFAVEPATGSIRWVERLDTVPQKGFYLCSGLEFDNFDLLYREGDGVAMSRWVFDRKTGKMSIDPWSAFAKQDTGGGAAMVPRGCWSYAPRHQRRIKSHTHFRPLVVFRDNMLLGGMQGMQSIYRRDFDLKGGEKFDTRWMTGWAASQVSRDGKMPWRSHRLAEKAKWQADLFDEKKADRTTEAMVLAKGRLFLASSSGELQIRSTEDGKLLAKQDIPTPLWDGMAIANGRLFVSTADGKLACYGEK